LGSDYQNSIKASRAFCGIEVLTPDQRAALAKIITHRKYIVDDAEESVMLQLARIGIIIYDTDSSFSYFPSYLLRIIYLRIISGSASAFVPNTLKELVRLAITSLNPNIFQNTLSLNVDKKPSEALWQNEIYSIIIKICSNHTVNPEMPSILKDEEKSHQESKKRKHVSDDEMDQDDDDDEEEDTKKEKRKKTRRSKIKKDKKDMDQDDDYDEEDTNKEKTKKN